jgi:hypothetical protein
MGSLVFLEIDYKNGRLARFGHSLSSNATYAAKFSVANIGGILARCRQVAF